MESVIFRHLEKWRQFFDRPDAQMRKKMGKRDDLQRSVTLPPIDYIKDNVVLPGDPGVRLLQRVDIRVSGNLIYVYCITDNAVCYHYL